ncbi:endonuclease/exonuclease/phosphatase family protein [Pseudomonas sp. zbq_18]|uniref:endonuclease/exonuclease/phosphatase family protein n=1 Tax=Pseudomonas sp. zbq_18 TaxID=3367251 RepID=UPI003709CA4E
MSKPKPARALFSLAMLGGLLLPLASGWLAGASGTLPWLLDLAAHWQWLFLGGLLLSALLQSRQDRRWLALLLATPLPWLSASASLEPGAGVELRVASANVNPNNRDITPLASWLEQAQPDLLVLLEVSPHYAQALQQLPSYTYRLVHAQDSPFSIALLSRLPLKNAQAHADDQGIVHLQAQTRFADCAIHITALHPMPPLTPAYHAQRNQQLNGLLVDDAQPRLLAGDLNATPWSSAFSGLQARGWRRASGLAPTWPSFGAGLLGIPIDHVLASRHWHLLGHERGPDIGSDHLPVLVRLALPPCPVGGAS